MTIRISIYCGILVLVVFCLVNNHRLAWRVLLQQQPQGCITEGLPVFPLINKVTPPPPPPPSHQPPRSTWHFFEYLPGPGEWPAQIMQRGSANLQKKTVSDLSPLTLTTGIPSLYRDAKKNLPDLLHSIVTQTVSADEVVIVVSQVIDPINATDGTDLCEKLHQWMLHTLASSTIPLQLVCVKDRLTAGRARNTIGRWATSDILSYVDSDDMELPNRNAVIKQEFHCHPGRRMVLHQFVRRPDDMKRLQQEILQQVLPKNDATTTATNKYQNSITSSHCTTTTNDGIGMKELHTILEQTHDRWWLHRDLTHGHMVVHRSVLDEVQFTSLYKGQDPVFVRDVLYLYGRQNEEAVIFLPDKLTSYFKSNKANKDLLQ